MLILPVVYTFLSTILLFLGARGSVPVKEKDNNRNRRPVGVIVKHNIDISSKTVESSTANST